jgi:paraquat-inducible protein B
MGMIDSIIPIPHYSITPLFFPGGFMSKPANKKVIGIFVLGAIALLVVALVIFGSGKIFKKNVPVVFYFEGSVTGLNIGSAVMIRGVQVGSVTNVVLQFNPQDMALRIPVYADFDPDKVVRIGGIKYEGAERAAMFKSLIEHGLRGQLQMQSMLTGLLMINLDFLPNTPVRLVGTDPKQFEIPTVPTTMEELSKKIEKLPIEEIFNKLADTLERVEEVISSPEVEGGIKDLAQGMKDVRKLIKSIDDEIKPMSASIQGTMKDTRALISNADKLVQNVDRQVEPLASKAGGTLDATRKLVSEVNGEVGPVASDLKKTLEEARGAIVQAQKTLQAAEGNYAENSAFYYELTEALSGLKEASRSISLLGEYLQRHPDSVLWGKGKPGGK